MPVLVTVSDCGTFAVFFSFTSAWFHRTRVVYVHMCINRHGDEHPELQAQACSLYHRDVTGHGCAKSKQPMLVGSNSLSDYGHGHAATRPHNISTHKYMHAYICSKHLWF